jgi:hypothetical protein
VPLHALGVVGCCCCQVDAKVSSKTIQRLQGQVEAKQQELGALNIKVCVSAACAWCSLNRVLAGCWQQNLQTGV